MGKPDGPYHVADIESYTELDLDRLSEAMTDGKGKASAPHTDEERVRTGIDELSGAANTSQGTSKSAAESTSTHKRKRREPTPERVPDRPRRNVQPIQRLSEGTKASSHRQAHMTTALAAAVSSGNMFTNLAVDQIQKETTTKQRAEHMQREDFEPPTREFMQQCAFRDKWEAGEQEELRSIEKDAVWREKPPPPGTKILPLIWIYRAKRNRMGEVVRWKCRLVAQGFLQLFGEDYDQTYSPVAKFTSIRTVLQQN